MSFFENINKISLSFPKEMEKGFRDYFFEKSIKILRIELLFVIFLYAIFGVLDTILVPEQKYLFFQIRYLVVIPILFVALLLSYLKGFKKIKEYVLGITYIFVGSGIIVMIITLPNNYMYYLGLMLVFAGTYFISNLKFTTASIVSWINVIIFNFCYINYTNEPINMIVAVNFFYISANLLNMFAAYNIELFNRKNYLLNKQLNNKRNSLEEEIDKRSQNLIQNELKFKTVADFTSDWEYWIGPDNKILYMSPSCEKITGYKSEEFISNPELINKIILNDDIIYWNQHNQRVCSVNEIYNEENIFFRILHKNGSVVFIEHMCRSIFDNKKNNLGRRVSNRDITERRALEDLILHSEAKHKAMINNIADVIAIIDERQINIYVSPNLEKWFGWLPDEIIGFNTLDNIHSDDIELVQDAFSYLFSKSENTLTASCRYKCKDNFYKWIEFNATNLISNPLINGILINFSDISQRKIVEEELVNAKTKAVESDKLKTAFLNNIRHEIRTPINGIIGFLTFLNDDDMDHNERNEIIGIINKSSKRLISTVENIVEISQIQTGHFNLEKSKIYINQMINRFNNIFHTTSYNNELEFKVINNLPQTFDYFISDQSKIFSIYTNLIDNAIKFTPAGFIKVHIENDTENIIFSINDTGVGIPHAKIYSIFENFSQIDVSETRKYEGSGLGLSIAKGYIELLGGKIWVESEEGKGSTFSFSVPIT